MILPQLSSQISEQTGQIHKQAKQIYDLKIKCAELEAQYLFLATLISSSSPEMTETLQKNAQELIQYLCDIGFEDSNVIGNLKRLFADPDFKRPHLRIVQSRS